MPITLSGGACAKGFVQRCVALFFSNGHVHMTRLCVFSKPPVHVSHTQVAEDERLLACRDALRDLYGKRGGAARPCRRRLLHTAFRIACRQARITNLCPRDGWHDAPAKCGQEHDGALPLS